MDGDEHKHRNSVEHVFHVWMNQRQDERREERLPWESDLYEWQGAMREMERLPIWLRRARMGELPTIHQQCSHSQPETIEHNVLRCALGRDVTECVLLKSLYALFTEYSKKPWYSDLTLEDADRMGARVCCWHIFRAVFGITGERKNAIDTSEGYVQDESDRRFWATVYDHLAGEDPDGEGEPVGADVEMRLLGTPKLPGMESRDVEMW